MPVRRLIILYLVMESRKAKRENWSRSQWVIFSLFGPLYGAEKVNLGCVYNTTSTPLDVCVALQTESHSHACTYPPTHSMLHRHTNTWRASHTRMCVAYKSYHTHTRQHSIIDDVFNKINIIWFEGKLNQRIMQLSCNWKVCCFFFFFFFSLQVRLSYFVPVDMNPHSEERKD